MQANNTETHVCNAQSNMTPQQQANPSTATASDNKNCNDAAPQRGACPSDQPSRSDKLPRQDADALLKREIKQKIFSNVNEDVTTRILKRKLHLMQNRVYAMKAMSVKAQSQNKNFEKEAEADAKKIHQYENMLETTTDMIDLLKQQVKEVENRFNECKVKCVLKNASDQRNEIEALKNVGVPLIESEMSDKKRKLNDQISLHQQRKSQAKEALAVFQKNFEEKKELVEKIENKQKKLAIKKLMLEEKYTYVKNNKNINIIELEQQITKQEQVITACLTEELKQEKEKSNNLNAKKVQMDNQLSASIESKKLIDSEIFALKTEEEKLSQALKEEKVKFEESQAERAAKIESVQGLLDELLKEKQLTQSSLAQLKELNVELEKGMEIANVNYKNTFELSEDLSSKVLEKQSELDRNNAIYLQEKFENTSKEDKLNELHAECDNLTEKINSITLRISTERERIDQMVLAQDKKYDEEKLKRATRVDEINRKRSYSIESLKYFAEKLQTLTPSFDKARKELNDQQDEYDDLKALVASKQKILDEANIQLEQRKIKQIQNECSLKSVFKSPYKNDSAPKKVKFNETLFFKSPTESSDCSSQAMDLMGKPLEDWAKMSYIIKSDINDDVLEATSF